MATKNGSGCEQLFRLRESTTVDPGFLYCGMILLLVANGLAQRLFDFIIVVFLGPEDDKMKYLPNARLIVQCTMCISGI